MNVTLRDLRAEDATWLDTWLGGCAASVRYDVVDADRPSQSLLEAIRDGLGASVITADEPVGVIAYRAHTPSPTDAIIEFIGLVPGHARRGHGQAAAALLAGELATAGVRRIFAPAPEVHGIGVYFWIRLGYRPLLREDWPCARPRIAWLARDLT